MMDFLFALIKELLADSLSIQSHFQCQDMIHLSEYSYLLHLQNLFISPFLLREYFC